MRFKLLISLPLIVGGFLGGFVFAEEGDKPFAEAHVVLQLADGDAESQTRVLSVANNLIKHYGGPDFRGHRDRRLRPGISAVVSGQSEPGAHCEPA